MFSFFFDSVNASSAAPEPSQPIVTIFPSSLLNPEQNSRFHMILSYTVLFRTLFTQGFGTSRPARYDSHPRRNALILEKNVPVQTQTSFT